MRMARSPGLCRATTRCLHLSPEGPRLRAQELPGTGHCPAVVVHGIRALRSQKAYPSVFSFWIKLPPPQGADPSGSGDPVTQACCPPCYVVLTEASVPLAGCVQGAGLDSSSWEGGPHLWPLGVDEHSPFLEATTLLRFRPSASFSLPLSQLTEPLTSLPGSGHGVGSRHMRE